MPETLQETEYAASAAGNDDWAPQRFDLLGFLAGIALQWRVVAGVTLLCLLASLLMAYLKKPYYEGEATFMPPVHDLSPFAAGGVGPSQILSISGLGVGPGAAYLGLLKSRSVQDSVVQQLDILKTYHLRDSEEARGFVASKAKFDVQTNGIITVTCRDESPEFATKLTNAYLVALYKLNQRMSANSVSQRREFYDEEVRQAREALEKAEAGLIETQQRGGILDPAGTMQLAISNQARLLTSIQSSEVQLAVLEQSHTADSPEVVRQRSEIAQLRAQLSQQQSSAVSAQARGLQAGGALPKLSLESARSLRDVKEREAIYEALLRQADVTKLSETDPGPQLQLIDTAVVPLRKAGPSRRNIVLAGTGIGLLLSLLYAATWRIAVRTYLSFRERMRVQEKSNRAA